MCDDNFQVTCCSIVLNNLKHSLENMKLKTSTIQIFVLTSEFLKIWINKIIWKLWRKIWKQFAFLSENLEKLVKKWPTQRYANPKATKKRSTKKYLLQVCISSRNFGKWFAEFCILSPILSIFKIGFKKVFVKKKRASCSIGHLWKF